MIELVLRRLLAASQIPLPVARAAAYAGVLAGVPNSALTDVVAVLAEGAIHGPDAARGLARELGG